MARERLDRVFGIAVNLEWARAHYFNDILQQVAQIAGNTSPTSFAILDERGRRVAGSLEPGEQQTAATRAFPVLFFDPTLVAVNPPADLVNGPGPSQPAPPATRRSYWRRAARGEASSLSARVSLCLR